MRGSAASSPQGAQANLFNSIPLWVLPSLSVTVQQCENNPVYYINDITPVQSKKRYYIVAPPWKM